jgi:signal transduction histidine kinase/ActR/RegA family two-component response regulator
MIAAPIPANDEERVKALHQLGILDTPPEERFERLTQIAMTVLRTPMASVSLIDKDRQWFKSSPGMGSGDIDRSISFCGHTILQKEPLVINDTHTDQRFHDNPVVVNSPGVRAYVGIPLFSRDNFCIGSLCVVDTQKRDFTAEEIKIMQSLAVVVENELTNVVLNESLEEAREARRAAEAADQAKSRFLAVVSHEIRTPLNGIIGITDLLAGTKLNKDQQEYVNIVHDSGNTLLALINDILDFSKIEEGKLELENTAIEVRRFLKETLSIHLHAGKTKGIELKNAVSDQVPATILGDVFRLRQILLNLVGNALKFTQEGSIEVTVSLDDPGKPRPQIVFRIRDTGMGMTPEGMLRLFQPFQQADSSISRTHGGTGLGLAVCKQLVELMGGEIWVESILGQGTEFAFAIPLHEGPKLANIAPRTGMTVTGSLPIGRLGRQLRVLVVDDNSINQKVATLVLSKLGCHIECASSGAECLGKLESNSYDVILMDMEMPEMSGCETTQHLRTRWERSRHWIIAVTAHVGEGIALQCEEAGMDDFLTKPLRVEPLRVALEKLEHARRS